ncbi:MAG: class I SAM-dependent methyltransferase [Brumimicrobium sp.]|nr:class I SAM-dependent methyltransferase [Brumimicrobium sp.]
MAKELPDVDHAASHYLLASIGKKVLRPGGKGLTKELIASLHISEGDKIVEFAPGQGFTTTSVLDKHPASYIGIDIDEEHVANLKKRFRSNGTHVEIMLADAEDTKLPDASQDKIFGEAMLSMHADQRKTRIIKEAARVLKSGGLYAIHELELNLKENCQDEKHAQIQRDLAMVSNVNARPLTFEEWTKLLEDEGFEVVSVERRPLKVLEPFRILADEGFFQTLKIGYNILTMPKSRERVLKMRKTFKLHYEHLNAIVIIAKKR